MSDSPAPGPVYSEPAVEDELSRVFEESDELSARADPERTPFQSKYKARELLNGLHTRFSTELNACSEDPRRAYLTEVVGRLEHRLGVNLIDTEETSAGEAKLLAAIAKLEHSPVQHCVELVHCLNYLGTLQCDRALHPEALASLQRALDTYNNALPILTAPARPPSSASPPAAGSASEPPSLLVAGSGAQSERVQARVTRLHSLHTHTLFYLAQVYGHLGKTNKSARYCQLTLERQLEGKEYSPAEWAQNAIQLSAYYINTANFPLAYQCLAAAQQIVPPVEGADPEELQRLHASLHRALGALALGQLAKSANRKLERELSAGTDESAKSERTPAESEEKEPAEPRVLFPSLKLNLPPSSRFALADTFDQARVLFMSGLSEYTKALKFFVLDGFVSEHVMIQQDTSALYRHLCVFETDPARAAKMHKRRVDALSPACAEISSHVYKEFHQQLCDEIARAYMDLLENKLRAHEQSGTADDPASIQKANSLAANAVAYHTKFIRSFEKNGELPADLDPSYHRPYLNALFTMARAYTKMYSLDVSELIKYQKLALDLFRQIGDFVERFKVEGWDQELAVCQQMATLLPQKVQRIIDQRTAFR